MTLNEYQIIEKYMLEHVDKNAHDSYHIYRVLNNALDIAKNYENINYDILITSCLLHDIARNDEMNNKIKCHAITGSVMAYNFLKQLGYEESFCNAVKECILTHRFRSNNEPKTLEAKILFDADKLDVIGPLGICRTLMYGGKFDIPLYVLDSNNKIDLKANLGANETFLSEYNYKLKNIHQKLYTEEAKEKAKEQERISTLFYEELLKQVDISTLNDKIKREIN